MPFIVYYTLGNGLAGADEVGLCSFRRRGSGASADISASRKWRAAAMVKRCVPRPPACCGRYDRWRSMAAGSRLPWPRRRCSTSATMSGLALAGECAWRCAASPKRPRSEAADLAFVLPDCDRHLLLQLPAVVLLKEHSSATRLGLFTLLTAPVFSSGCWRWRRSASRSRRGWWRLAAVAGGIVLAGTAPEAKGLKQWTVSFDQRGESSSCRPVGSGSGLLPQLVAPTSVSPASRRCRSFAPDRAGGARLSSLTAGPSANHAGMPPAPPARRRDRPSAFESGDPALCLQPGMPRRRCSG